MDTGTVYKVEEKHEYGEALCDRIILADGVSRTSRERNCKIRVGTISVHG